MLEGQHLEPTGRLAQFVRMVEAFERGEIETAVDALIARLDERDGDVDAELNGDERDGSYSHEETDGWIPWLRELGPGDPIDAEESDEDRCEARDDEPRSGLVSSAMRALDCHDLGSEDDAEPAAWIEWTSRGRQKLEYGGERLTRDRNRNAVHEDVEDDDGDMGIEDEPHDAEEDTGIEDDPHDPDESEEADDEVSRLAMRPHRDRIRRTRCDRIVYPPSHRTGREHVEYRLRAPSPTGGREMGL